ncbi:MAG: hypothetical protein H6595_02025 [Flavobacteriales bacterium]|nr:hypothetical protein [Flavobacteriales bacterium]MCB9166235.1 hypothetical protein [Flavobacteriales bacterium]
MHRTLPFLSFLLLFVNTPGRGQWSALDPTFGQNGYAHLDVNGQSYGFSGLVLPDDRIVVAGTFIINNEFWAAIARFMPDGSLDPTFGAGGVDSADVSGAMGYVVDMARQPDGKLVVLSSISNTSYLVFRFLPDGGLDQGFGSNGSSVFPGGNGYDPVALALQADGKVVVTGRYDYYSSSGARLLLFRLNADGSLDTGFGNMGAVQQDIGTLGKEAPSDLLVLPDGNVLVAGTVSYSSSGTQRYPHFFLRYAPDGTLDNSFGNGGMVVDSLGTGQYLSMGDLIGLPSGGWLAGGSVSQNDSSRSVVARFLPGGMLDPAFANGGMQVLEQPGRQYQGLSGIAQRADGSILFGGSAENEFGANYVEFVGHLGADGSIDTDYGGPTGMQVLDPAAFDNHLRLGFRTVMAQSTGKLVGITDIQYGGSIGRQLTVFRVEQLSTGVQERSAPARLSIHPNPVDGQLFVRSTMDASELVLIDVHGRIVHVFRERTGLTAGSTVTLDWPEAVPVGTYLLRSCGAKGCASALVVKR